MQQYLADAYLADIDIRDYWPLSDKNGGFKNISQMVTSLTSTIIIIGGVVFFLLIVIAGVGLIVGAGSGDAHATENRQQFLTFAVIGFVIMFTAFWIVQLISYITGGSLSIIGL